MCLAKTFDPHFLVNLSHCINGTIIQIFTKPFHSENESRSEARKAAAAEKPSFTYLAPSNRKVNS